LATGLQLNWLYHHGLEGAWRLRLVVALVGGWVLPWLFFRLRELIKGYEPARALPPLGWLVKSKISRLVFGGVLICAVGLGAFHCFFGKTTLQDERLLVGAPYYLWYPANFREGFLRNKLLPPQKPVLGLYDSTDPKTAESHIAWCSSHGIDFLALNWWPSRKKQNSAIEKAFLKAKNISDIKFCIFYETWDLAWDPKAGATVFDSKTSRLLNQDVLNLAERFFDHPCYLKLNGRPVLFFYLTRTLWGEYAAAFKALRENLKQKGYDAFFIADEIYYQTLSAEKPMQKPVSPLPLADAPQLKRIELFDAIYAYNMYLSGVGHHMGYGGQSAFLGDVKRVYGIYQRACAKDKYFVPGVIPGYNDRGPRLKADHHAIPRRWLPDQKEGSFLQEMLRQVGLPFSDPKLNMLMITSFNEWNEDTAIEPVAAAPATKKDQSESGRAYTQGYAYAGFGNAYLKVIRDRLHAVWGRVTNEKGLPKSGIAVYATDWWGFKVLKTRTDSQGYYTFSRLNMTPGKYRVSPALGASRWITLEENASATRLDLNSQ
jgi:hypothetical protein